MNILDLTSWKELPRSNGKFPHSRHNLQLLSKFVVSGILRALHFRNARTHPYVLNPNFQNSYAEQETQRSHDGDENGNDDDEDADDDYLGHD
eukprot:7407596-Karenia_brevis.AAC.1